MCAPSESRLAGDAVPDDCRVIEMRVAELRQLFHSNDPSPFRERDLDPAAERFIVDWSRELPSSILVGDWVAGFFAEHRPQENQVMQPRVDYAKAAPEVRAAMQTLDDHVRQTDLDRGLIELVKLRASLLNGCAYCVDMHTKIARALGETEQRLYAVSVWRETSFYSPSERAALAWTEAVTLVNVSHVPDDVYELARQHFAEKELIDLTLAIVAINAWNRVAIAFTAVPGTFQVATPPTAGPPRLIPSDS